MLKKMLFWWYPAPWIALQLESALAGLEPTSGDSVWNFNFQSASQVNQFNTWNKFNNLALFKDCPVAGKTRIRIVKLFDLNCLELLPRNNCQGISMTGARMLIASAASSTGRNASNAALTPQCQQHGISTLSKRSFLAPSGLPALHGQFLIPSPSQ